MPRKSPSKRIFDTTLKYQKRWPAFSNGERVPGRIDLKKRPDYNKKITRILVSDRKLSALLDSTRISKKEYYERIINYALKKGKGDKKKAIDFLKKVSESILARGDLNSASVRRLAYEEGFKGNEAEIFYIQFEHMYGPRVGNARSVIAFCIRELK